MFRSFLAVCLTVAACAAQSSAPDSALKEALALHQRGDFEGAIRQYRAFLKVNPGAYQIRSNLGAALANAGRYQEAIVEYQAALARDPRNPGIAMNLALAQYKSGNVTEASRGFAAIHRADPGNSQVLLLDADCQLRLGHNQEVIALLTPVAAQTPPDLGVVYMLGTALIRDHQVEKGQAVIDRLLRAGDSAEARLLLGTSRIGVNDFAGALQDLAQAVKLNPELPEVWGYYGAALLRTGDQAGAVAAFRRELAANPNDFESNLQLGALLRQDQLYPEARRYLERALLVRPRDPGVRYQLAAIQLAEGRLPRALVELESLVRENPAFVEAHVTLATVYYRLQRRPDGDRERALVEKLNQELQARQPGAAAP